ncbi:MAG TPA: acyl-ACP--UDP-N-acetylglucosamine O-acyltransferase [Candidatus Avidesulfovibrio excrementigallinarum]|nr:acyl-ACP--UDP-N-acetylglucosamine O-acyltransferase [Candidatus Avidesulfovibrio excrementigallinarum]
MSIHPTAIVAPGAVLGQNVVVGPFAIIEDAVTIGDDCRIDSHAIIKSNTRLGARNHVHSHALVGGDPQDLKYHGEESWLEIGDDNRIREFATLHRGTEGGGGVTRVGNNNLLMAYTHVAHDCQLGNGIIMSNNATLAGHVTVADYAIIGGLSAVHQFVRIGTHAFVGGVTGVPQDVPPWMLVAGSRGSVRGPNIVGLRRAGASREAVAGIKYAFRTLWWSGLLRADALDKIMNEYGNIKEVAQFVDFVRTSQRGICPVEKAIGSEKSEA